jgi:DnaJ-like protein
VDGAGAAPFYSRGMQHESCIDRQIREAQERGAFDNLPGAGRPLHLDPDEDWWIKAKLKRENLEAVLPGPLLLRREVEQVQQTLAEVTTEAAAREILEHLNERIRAHYARPSAGPVIVVRLVDVEAELLSWRRARTR